MLSTLRLTLFLALAWALPACGDSGSGGGDATSGTGSGTGSDGGDTSGTTAPPLTLADCPSAPENLTLIPIAPVWNGLMQLTFDLKGKGSVAEAGVQMFDPALGVWGPVSNQIGQREDGKYVATVFPRVTEQNKGGNFKLRVRAQLLGCTHSVWAESPGFSLQPPFKGTTWAANFEPHQYHDSLSFLVTAGAGTATGPYTISDPPPKHTVTFRDDGTLDESFEFAVKSATPGDKFDGCSFKVAAQGKWETEFAQGYMRLSLSKRKVSSFAGSSCADPPLAELPFTQQNLTFAGGLFGAEIDYADLRYSPPGRAKWRDGGMQYELLLPFTLLTDATEPDMVNVYNLPSFFSAAYELQ